MRTPQRSNSSTTFGLARDLGVREFLFGQGHEVRDDHLALNDIAKIPTIDIIDFDYPNARGVSYWHTTQDIPERCSHRFPSPSRLVLKTWLERQK